MSRLARIATAERPAMKAKALLSGPSGAGKTWSALSIGTVLAEGGPILVIDTEKESALTYADSFRFEHLPWDPPFDPTELAETLIAINDSYAVVIVDSLTHFWMGTGGTLDIAGGHFTGWKGARPKQNRLIDILVGVPAHALYCVRSKMEYVATAKNGGKSYDVERVGLAPVQDDTLMYEMNVALDLDLEHNITVTKSRTPAVPVGRMYPASHERKCAEDYAAWLAGGVPPASPDDVKAVLDAFDNVRDNDVRKELKLRFKAEVGTPDTLTETQIDGALAWLADNITDEDSVPVADTPSSDGNGDSDGSEVPPPPEPSPETEEPPIPPEGGSSVDTAAVLGDNPTINEAKAWARARSLDLPAASGWARPDWQNWAFEKERELAEVSA